MNTKKKTHSRQVPKDVMDYLIEGNSKEDLIQWLCDSMSPFEYRMLLNEVKQFKDEVANA